MTETALIMPAERPTPPARIPVEHDATGMLAIIASAARDPAMDIDKVQRLVDMRERELARVAEIEFSAALADMQQDIPVIAKHGAITFEKNNEIITKGRFAKFEDIDRAIKPVLFKYGFAISHKQRMEGGRVIVTTTLRHRSGHSESTEFESAPDVSGNKNAIQAQGSSISYGKRQNVKALLNIAEGDEDDDGAGSQPPALMTPDHQATAQAKCEEISKGTLGSVLKNYKVRSLAEIPDSEYERIINRLEITARERAARQAGAAA